MEQFLFLDFDGVLNNTGWYKTQTAAMERKDQRHALYKPYNPSDDLDPKNLAQLAEIARRVPGLKVVVSSSWRCGRTLDELRGYLLAAFAPERVVGVTPRLEGRMRSEEINHWLGNHHKAGDMKFLALDDDTFDMVQLGGNFLHVDRSAGLTPEHVKRVVRHFGEGA